MSCPRTWLGSAISLICLALAVQGVRWPEVWSQLTRADLLLLATSAAVIVGLIEARAARWGVLLMELRGGASQRQLLSALTIGYMANNLLPARVGDLLRAYLWGDWMGVSKAAVVSTVVVERLVDLLFAFACMLLFLPVVVLPDWALMSWLGAGTMGAAALAVLALLAIRQSVVLELADSVMRVFPRLSRLPLRSWVLSLLHGLEVLRQPGRAGSILLWSTLIWTGQVVYTYAVIRSLGLDVPLAAAAVVLVLTSLGTAVPSAPGGAGVYHLVAVVSLALFAVEREPALGAALLIHSVSYVIVSGTGVFFAWQAGLPWSRMHHVPSSIRISSSDGLGGG